MVAYTITQFNSLEHTAVIEFTSQVNNNEVRLGISIPIVGTRYITGSDLDTFISSIVDNHERLLTNHALVSNAADIQALVVAPVVTPIVYTEQEKDDILADAARKDRDITMKLTDWTQVNDVTLTPTEVAAWAAYRTELRNISSLPGFPRTFAWPQPPGAIKKTNQIQLQADGTLITTKNNYKPALAKVGL